MDFLPSLSFLGPRACVFVLGVVSVVWYLRGIAVQRKRNPRRLPLPPGPRGLPIIGNLLQVPTVKPWIKYDAMASQYGDLVYLNVLGQGVLILGSLPQAVELLEKKAASNSDRPPVPAVELIDAQWAFALMPYGTEWKQHRRVFHQHMNRNVVSGYHPIMYEEIVKLLQTLSKDRKNFMEHMEKSFGTMILRSAYGFDDVGETLEALLHDSRALLEIGTDINVPGKYLVNVFPILKYVPEWFPGTGYHKYLKKGAILSRRVLHSPFDNAKLDAANGRRSVHPSTAARLIDSIQHEVEEKRASQEFVARAICATSFAAGSDTTVSFCIALVFVLATHPEVREEAQAELNTVIGPNRLPAMKDHASLPYIQAIVKEIGRWYTVDPLGTCLLLVFEPSGHLYLGIHPLTNHVLFLGLPHSNTEDDEHEDYFIPKGTILLANAWSVTLQFTFTNKVEDMDKRQTSRDHCDRS